MSLENAPDKELIESYLKDNNEAFKELYNRYKNALYGYLNKMLPGQHAVIDDIFQKTWIKVIKNLEKYKDNQKFSAWLFRISHNETMDYFRKRKREVSIEDSNKEIFYSGLEKVNSEQPWKEIDKKELKTLLKNCLSELSPAQKEVFLLRQEEFSFKEIAQIQDISINTALSRMQYALKALRICIKARTSEKQ
jgi:RNA polymerase sigma-70 factor (ECF subfamily)